MNRALKASDKVAIVLGVMGWMAGIPVERIRSRERRLDAIFCRQLVIWYLRRRAGVFRDDLGRVFRLSANAINHAVRVVDTRLRHPKAEMSGLPRVIEVLDAQVRRAAQMLGAV